MSERARILPPMSRTWRDAATFAKVAHEGQTDKAGEPYWKHLKRVEIGAIDKLPWNATDDAQDHVSQIAWLHDVIEDTPYTADDLLAEGFSKIVVRAVVALTKPSGRSNYLSSIHALCLGATLPIILVKLADNEDNSDPARLALLDEETAARLAAKYAAAREILVAAAESRGWIDRRVAV